MSITRCKTEETEVTELAPEELDLVVGKLRQISREVTLDYAIRVGSLIVHYIYGGDTRALHEKRAKPISFRRLAERPDLPMSPTALYRCVATFVLCERLDVVSRWKHLTVSHLRTVLNLDTAEQARLLSAANAQRWTVEKLETEARFARARGMPVGRPPASPLVKFARGLARCLDDNSQALGELTDLADLSDDQQEQVRRTLEQARNSLERACEALRCRSIPDRHSSGCATFGPHAALPSKAASRLTAV